MPCARDHAPLTPRRLEVLELMARGLTNPDIAGVLGIARATVKAHVAALVALAITLPPSMLLAGSLLGGTYAVGLVAFYLYYEVLHRREHTHAGIGAYGRWARRHHFYHHFVDPSMNHGVTSPIWDLVFGTYRAPGVIPVPAKRKMQWLTHPDTGEIHAAYASWYTLRGRAH